MICSAFSRLRGLPDMSRWTAESACCVALKCDVLTQNAVGSATYVTANGENTAATSSPTGVFTIHTCLVKLFQCLDLHSIPLYLKVWLIGKKGAFSFGISTYLCHKLRSFFKKNFEGIIVIRSFDPFEQLDWKGFEKKWNGYKYSNPCFVRTIS